MNRSHPWYNVQMKNQAIGGNLLLTVPPVPNFYNDIMIK